MFYLFVCFSVFINNCKTFYFNKNLFQGIKKDTTFFYRLNDQVFIFYSMEAPPALKTRDLYFKEYDNYFNLTMSYRLVFDK